jgi:radical SAM protein with 4Fe4S-binding SPASM domain
MKHNENEIQEIKDLAKQLKADKLILKKLCNLNGFPEQLRDIEDYIPDNPDFKAYRIEYNSIKWNTHKQDKNRCSMCWNYPAINWDGSLSPCCFDYESYLNMGNVFESSFKNVWNNKKFISLRRNILRNKSSIPICSKCPVNFYEDIVEEVSFK